MRAQRLPVRVVSPSLYRCSNVSVSIRRSIAGFAMNKTSSFAIRAQRVRPKFSLFDSSVFVSMNTLKQSSSLSCDFV